VMVLRPVIADEQPHMFSSSLVPDLASSLRENNQRP